MVCWVGIIIIILIIIIIIIIIDILAVKDSFLGIGSVLIVAGKGAGPRGTSALGAGHLGFKMGMGSHRKVGLEVQGEEACNRGVVAYGMGGVNEVGPTGRDQQVSGGGNPGNKVNAGGGKGVPGGWVGGFATSAWLGRGGIGGLGRGGGGSARASTGGASVDGAGEGCYGLGRYEDDFGRGCGKFGGEGEKANFLLRRLPLLRHPRRSSNGLRSCC